MNTDTTAPDYGEPWSKSTFYAAEEYTNLGTIRRRDIEDHAVVFWCQPDPDTVERIIACVNACAGMPDPAAEIEAMREAMQAAYVALAHLKEKDWYNSDTRGPIVCLVDAVKTRAALAKLEPFIKP